MSERISARPECPGRGHTSTLLSSRFIEQCLCSDLRQDTFVNTRDAGLAGIALSQPTIPYLALRRPALSHFMSTAQLHSLLTVVHAPPPTLFNLSIPSQQIHTPSTMRKISRCQNQHQPFLFLLMTLLALIYLAFTGFFVSDGNEQHIWPTSSRRTMYVRIHARLQAIVRLSGC